MTETMAPGLTLTEASLLSGKSVEAIRKAAQRGRIRAWKEGDEWRVVLPERVINGAATSDDENEQSEDSTGELVPIGPAGQLAALSEYNRRLIEPWADRVKSLEVQQLRDREQIGDLSRQVRELKRALVGMQAALTQLVRPSDG